MSSLVKEYKYDVAISLCNQDADFARNLKALINPSLNVFFYEQNQEEIISKSGPEVFGSVFKDSRIVVILSRNEWGDSYYTGIEKSSILDRTSVKGEGYDFLMVIPMMPNETPIWYPSTKIYANPQNSSFEELARFIEFKVSEAGGVVKPLTFEDSHRYFLQRIEAKKTLIELQRTDSAISNMLHEISVLEIEINKKKNEIKGSNYWGVSEQSWHQPFGACFAIEDFLLEIRIDISYNRYGNITSTQDYTLSVAISKVIGIINNLYDASENKKLLAANEYKFLYDLANKGWSMPYLGKNKITEKEAQILFRFRNKDEVTPTYYNLKNPVDSISLIDNWFQELLKYATTEVNIFL